MRKRSIRLPLIALALPLAILAGGCTATTRDVSPDEKIHYDEAYDFTDKKTIVRTLVDSLSRSGIGARGEGKPILIVYPVANRTSEHIQTDGITDDIRKELVNLGTFRFINEAQRENIARETRYQYGGAVDPAMRVERGRQLGADLIMSGTLRSIEKEEPRQVRLRKRSLRYYSLNLELTDLKTGEIVWADSVEVIREAAKPFIGW